METERKAGGYYSITTIARNTFKTYMYMYMYMLTSIHCCELYRVDVYR